MMPPMPRVPPFDRPATYEDLAALPDNLVAEIVGGEPFTDIEIELQALWAD
jgi:hypothetical protein